MIKAAHCGYTEIIQLLLERRADIETKNNDGNTALILAAANGKAEAVKLLLYEGAELDIANKDGNTALILAAKCDRIDSNSFDTVDALIKAEAVIPDPEKYADVRDCRIRTLLETAWQKKLEQQGQLTKSAAKACRRDCGVGVAGAGNGLG